MASEAPSGVEVRQTFRDFSLSLLSPPPPRGIASLLGDMAGAVRGRGRGEGDWHRRKRRERPSPGTKRDLRGETRYKYYLSFFVPIEMLSLPRRPYGQALKQFPAIVLS